MLAIILLGILFVIGMIVYEIPKRLNEINNNTERLMYQFKEVNLKLDNLTKKLEEKENKVHE